MPKCGLCGGDAPRKPSITDDGKCDLCEKPVVRAEDAPAKSRFAGAEDRIQMTEDRIVKRL